MRRIFFLLAILLLPAFAHAQLRMVPNTPIYDDNADAKKEIREAIATAKTQNKRLLLVFGANWCYDCHVLDYRFKDPEIEPFLNQYFLVVHVDIGQGEKNVDVAKKYQIRLDRGVPAIAVLEKTGALLFSQKNGEFAPARRLPPQQFITFLQRWAPR